MRPIHLHYKWPLRLLPQDLISSSTKLEKPRTAPDYLTPNSPIPTQILRVPSEDHLTASQEVTSSAHYVQVERGQRRQWCLSKSVFGKQHSFIHKKQWLLSIYYIFTDMWGCSVQQDTARNCRGKAFSWFESFFYSIWTNNFLLDFENLIEAKGPHFRCKFWGSWALCPRC